MEGGDGKLSPCVDQIDEGEYQYKTIKVRSESNNGGKGI